MRVFKTSRIFLVILLSSVFFIVQCTENSTGHSPGKKYDYLPENLIAVSADGNIQARYTGPTTRYGHGVLGDAIEAGGLLLLKNGKEYYLELDTNFVFEDLRPRLKDVNNDGEPEIITIQSSLNEGASIAVYEISDGKLSLFSQSKYIGRSNKWLNIAAIEDLDGDGNVEIAWVETPHGPGILTVAAIEKNSFTILDVFPGVSNHKTGSRNLCLSAVTSNKILYVPSREFNELLGFSLEDGKIRHLETLPLTINPDMSIHKQLPFDNILHDENCVTIE